MVSAGAPRQTCLDLQTAGVGVQGLVVRGLAFRGLEFRLEGFMSNTDKYYIYIYIYIYIHPSLPRSMHPSDSCIHIHVHTITCMFDMQAPRFGLAKCGASAG